MIQKNTHANFKNIYILCLKVKHVPLKKQIIILYVRLYGVNMYGINLSKPKI